MDSNKPSAWTPQMSQRSSWSCQSNQTKVATIQTRMCALKACVGVWVSEGPGSGTDMSGQADGLRSQTDASDV
ncbi:hypothetical protein SCLCIDRAFT_1223026 [Scleroderma citrinum Foug A]|uniref:Uncharacterized protein n=1 Tax=Scleroderma citrinum Foug A TaxID=1036808 RepID=A0A0C2ZKL9_9AGAM|nr:hypothetical protein SCLCIDRAFT_1223026 [Scleroderma citrinum Foug A]